MVGGREVFLEEASCSCTYYGRWVGSASARRPRREAEGLAQAKAQRGESDFRAGKMSAAPWLARWGGEAGVGSWKAPASPRPGLQVSPPPLPA